MSKRKWSKHPSPWGAWLRQQLQDRGWSVEELAGRANPTLNPSTIYKQLQGRRTPTRIVRAMVEKALGARFERGA